MKSLQLHIDSVKAVITELKTGKYVIYFIPGIAAALLFGSIFSITNKTENLFDFVEHIPLIGGFLSTGVEKTFGLFYFIILQIYVFFVLTLLSPFNTLLSEAVDSNLTGKKYPFNIIEVLSDLARMIFIVLVSLILEFFLMGAYWILSWILGLGFLDTIVYTVVSAFFFGLSFYDYSLERYRQGVFSTFGFAFSNILAVTITGLIFTFIFAIPFIGIPLSPVLATMIATIVYIKKCPSDL